MIKAVLFDFDYTLADSSEAVVDCFNTGLAALGLPKAAPDAIRRTIGLSIPESLACIAGREHLPRVEEFRLSWRRRSDEIMVAWTKVFDWTAPAIEELREAGLALGIVSTKYRSRIESTLRPHGLIEHFSVIVGGEDVERHKPDPEGLLLGLAGLGVGPNEAVYVGDTVADATAAQSAGTAFVGVLSGMTEAAELERLPNLGVLPHIGALPAFIGTACASLR